jgi:midasin
MEVFGGLMLDFFTWFGERLGDAMGLRDILAWVDFMNRTVKQGLPLADAFVSCKLRRG